MIPAQDRIKITNTSYYAPAEGH